MQRISDKTRKTLIDSRRWLCVIAVRACCANESGKRDTAKRGPWIIEITLSEREMCSGMSFISTVSAKRWPFAFQNRGISLTSGDVCFVNVFTHLATMNRNLMCPLEMCVIIHIERGMSFETNFFLLYWLSNLQPSAPSFALRYIFAID